MRNVDESAVVDVDCLEDVEEVGKMYQRAPGRLAFWPLIGWSQLHSYFSNASPNWATSGQKFYGRDRSEQRQRGTSSGSAESSEEDTISRCCNDCYGRSLPCELPLPSLQSVTSFVDAESRTDPWCISRNPCWRSHDTRVRNAQDINSLSWHIINYTRSMESRSSFHQMPTISRGRSTNHG